MGDPASGLPEHALVFRPSLWSAVEGLVRFLFIATVSIFLLILPLLADEEPSGERVFRGEAIFDAFQTLAEFAGLFAVALVPAIRILFTRYSLGPDDLRVRRQLLERHEQRVPWQKVTGVRYRRTLFDRLVGLERVDVIAYGRHVMGRSRPGSTVTLVGLPRGSGVHDMVARKMRSTATVDSLFEND